MPTTIETMYLNKMMDYSISDRNQMFNKENVETMGLEKRRNSASFPIECPIKSRHLHEEVTRREAQYLQEFYNSSTWMMYHRISSRRRNQATSGMHIKLEKFETKKPNDDLHQEEKVEFSDSENDIQSSSIDAFEGIFELELWNDFIALPMFIPAPPQQILVIKKCKILRHMYIDHSFILLTYICLTNYGD